jgi:hypothetical protein
MPVANFSLMTALATLESRCTGEVRIFTRRPRYNGIDEEVESFLSAYRSLRFAGSNSAGYSSARCVDAKIKFGILRLISPQSFRGEELVPVWLQGTGF